ncbi:MAG: hypothetical protein OXR84_01490 [Magnetovibrio sp.]|nr:hypothetical protein [Magnetovibrio sp.]
MLQVLRRLLHRLLTFGCGLGRLLCLLSFLVQAQHVRTQQLGNFVQSLRQLAGLLLQLLLPGCLSRLPLLRRIRDPLKPLGQLLLLLSQLLGPRGQLRRTLLQTLRGLLRIRRRLLSLLRRLIKLPGLGLLSGVVRVRSRLGRRLSRRRIRSRLLSRFDRQLSGFCGEALLLLEKLLSRWLFALRLSTLWLARLRLSAFRLPALRLRPGLALR